MKILIPGHRYALANFERTQPEQELQFIQKEPVEPGSTTLKTISDGTTNEEVLAVIIDRLDTMYKKLPSQETMLAFSHIQQALMWLNHRTAMRRQAGTEGTMKP